MVAAIISWNSPLITLANKIAPALAGGNTMVVKPSEYASASVLEFVRLIADLLPAGVLNVVTGVGPETGAALVSHPDVAKITFTGGPETARAILGSAARTLRPSLMELGGKGPMIVAADADLDLAVQDALMGIYLANGEACIASSRLLLHDEVHDEFVERFAAVARRIKVGDATDQASEMGPLVSRQQLDWFRATSNEHGQREFPSSWVTNLSTSTRHSRAVSSSGPFCSPIRMVGRRLREPKSSDPSRSLSVTAATTRPSGGRTSRGTGLRRECGRVICGVPTSSRINSTRASCG